MAESIIYFFLLLAFCIFDIKRMVTSKLRKEIIPYLFLVILAAFVGFVGFKNPYGNSIAHNIIRLFHVRG